MLPVFIPYSEPKRNYKFIWYMGRDDQFVPPLSLHVNKIYAKYVSLMNHVFTTYISQLAESVNLPDDEIETEDYEVGMLKIPVPVRINMPDIQVTYLEDTNDTVYNFHKSWISFIRHGDTFCLESFYPYSINGRFITFENTLEAFELAGLVKSMEAGRELDAGMNGGTNNVMSQVIQALGVGNLDLLSIPHSIYNYPHIFPYKISRDNADKKGDGLSHVTVTYKRLPKMKIRKPYENLKGAKFFTKEPTSKLTVNNINFTDMAYNQQYRS